MLKGTYINYMSKLYSSNLTRMILKASGLDKPIIGMTEEESISQLKKSFRKLRCIQIAMDTVIGTAIIGAVYAAYNMIF